MGRKTSKKESIFKEDRLDDSEQELLLELLYSQEIQINKLERIRSNLSTIVWIIVIQIFLGIIVFVYATGGFGLTILDWTQSCENCCYII